MDAVRSRLAVLAAVGSLGGCQMLAEAPGRIANLPKKTYDFARAQLTSSYDDPEFEHKLARADQMFEQEDYAAARKVFGDLAGNTTNPVLVAEKARFMEAECYRLERKYPEAMDTYHKMLTDFDRGAYREQACGKMFEIADYWLDDTRDEIKATEAGESVTVRKAARLFRFDRSKPTLDQEGRAVQALENVHLHDAAGPTADKALFWAGYVSFYRGKFEEADHYFSLLVETCRDSPLRPTATELAIIAKNNSTGGSAYDGQKAAEALQLVHHAEASMPELRTPEKAEMLTRQKLAIRMQQAEKDYKVARFWEQTGHPGSAYFSYEVVRRRYPGTKYGELAAERMQALHAKAAEDAKNPPRRSLFAGLKRNFDAATGRPPAQVGDPDVPTSAGTVPPRPADLVPAGGVADDRR